MGDHGFVPHQASQCLRPSVRRVRTPEWPGWQNRPKRFRDDKGFPIADRQGQRTAGREEDAVGKEHQVCLPEQFRDCSISDVAEELDSFPKLMGQCPQVVVEPDMRMSLPQTRGKSSRNDELPVRKFRGYLTKGTQGDVNAFVPFQISKQQNTFGPFSEKQNQSTNNGFFVAVSIGFFLLVLLDEA